MILYDIFLHDRPCLEAVIICGAIAVETYWQQKSCSDSTIYYLYINYKLDLRIKQESQF